MRQTALEWLEKELNWMEESKNTHYINLKIKQAKEMEREQQEYKWDNCKKIIHEGFVYVKYNDLLECEKSFKNCT